MKRAANEYGNFKCYEAECSKDRRILKYYDQPSSPAFVICLWGRLHLAQIGANYENLKQKLEKYNSI